MEEKNMKKKKYCNLFKTNNVNIIMHKIFRKKKGSTLMMVMAVMAILMISGTAILSLSLSGYKYRGIEESKKMSLYASEAGINKAYGKIQEYVDNAIAQGNTAVEAYNDGLSGLLDSEIGKISTNSSLTSEYIGNVVRDSDNNNIIISYSVNENKINADRRSVFNNGYTLNTIAVVGYNGYVMDNWTSLANSLKIGNSDDNINITPTINSGLTLPELLKVELDSKYTTNSIPRQLKVTYYINEAQYNKKYNTPSQIVKLPKVGYSKALIVGGDMNIKDNSVATIKNSDIYVAGSDSGNGINIDGNSSTLNIYNGSLVTLKDVNISGSADALNVKSDGTTNAFSGNVYARNFFVKSSASSATVNLGDISSSSTGTVPPYRDGSLYTLDDLEINGEKKSIVNIGGDYNGVSDGSEGSVDSNGYHNDPDNSSSIIVNAEDIGGGAEGSSLTIKKNVNIAGTSYVTLAGDKKYQTGESISVKGNYIAYTQPLIKDSTPQNFRENNVIFEYLDPLNLVTKFNITNTASGDIVAILDNSNYVNVSLTDAGKINYKDILFYQIYLGDNTISSITPIGSTVHITVDSAVNDNVTIKLYKTIDDKLPQFANVQLKQNSILTAFDKSQYFKFYEDEYADNSGLNLKGIKVSGNKNINMGAIIKDNNSIAESSFSVDLYGNMLAKAVQLKNQIFYMGMGNEMKNINTDIDNIVDLYDDPDLHKLLEINNENQAVVNINNIFNFTKNANQNSANEVLYLKSDNTKTVLSGAGSSFTGSNPVDMSSNKSGIIIVDGDLEVYGQVNFTGMIICNGTLTIEPSSNLNITYDEEYLHNFVIKNCSVLSNVFKFPYETNDPAKYVTATIFSNTSTVEDESNSVITMDRWQLIK